ncbi:MAG TPA: FmdB family zinc ribbon protein, partial [Candidatus Limnocylindrales bacterium]|nr:FmdB family zinc ribbon protein [Candidatus Limnocylindrales bacterium]
MPIYDYACSACSRVTEVVHGINDHVPKFCPECGAEGTMTKNFTTPAIHFKGTGWAKKDRGSSARTAAKAKDDGTTAKDSAAK